MNKGTRFQGQGMCREAGPRHRGRFRAFGILSGYAVLLAFSGCSKVQTGIPSSNGGSPSGGSQGQGGKGGSGGTSTVSQGGSSAGGSTGGASTARSDASASGGAL